MVHCLYHFSGHHLWNLPKTPSGQTTRLVSNLASDTTRSRIEFDYQFATDGTPIPNASSSVPAALLDTFGVASFHDIAGVNLDGDRVTLSDISAMASLHNLRRLDLELSLIHI